MYKFYLLPRWSLDYPPAAVHRSYLWYHMIVHRLEIGVYATESQPYHAFSLESASKGLHPSLHVIYVSNANMFVKSIWTLFSGWAVVVHIVYLWKFAGEYKIYAV